MGQSIGIEGRPGITLVADNEKGMHLLYKTYLGEEGYRAKIFGNGQKAFKYYRRNKQDIAAVITDYMMPKLDCLKFMKSLREDGFDVPIAVVCCGLIDLETDDKKEILNYADLLEEKDEVTIKMGNFVKKLLRAMDLRTQTPGLQGFYATHGIGLST